MFAIASLRRRKFEFWFLSRETPHGFACFSQPFAFFLEWRTTVTVMMLLLQRNNFLGNNTTKIFSLLSVVYHKAHMLPCIPTYFVCLRFVYNTIIMNFCLETLKMMNFQSLPSFKDRAIPCPNHVLTMS